MTSKTLKFRPSPALVISCVALFMALVGSAYAAGLAKNSVHSRQIANGTVRTVDLHNQAVNAAKIAPDAVGSEALAPDSVTSQELAPNSVGPQQIADNAVESSDVAPDSLTAEDLAANSVGSSEVADHSLTGADIAPDSIRASELGPITQRTNSATIKAGATGSVSVSCGQDEQLISGGGQPSVFGVEMTTTRPTGNAWLYQAKNNTGADATITAFALCLLP
jgi:hypothetical protein